MALINSPPNTSVDGFARGALTPPAEGWRGFFNAAFNICNAVSMSGLTVNRPTSFMYIGRTYFDTDLGIPIWLQSYPPAVWCDATGAPV